MVIPDVELIFFTEIIQTALRNRVKRKSFPHQNVAFVFFIFDYADNCCFGPSGAAAFGLIP